MTMTDLPPITVGSLVTIDSPAWPGLHRVLKVNPTTYRCESLESGRTVRAHRSLCSPHTGDGPAPVPTSLAVGVPYRAPFDQGQVVLWSDPRGGGHPYVVIDDRIQTVRIVRLGGDSGRYWRIPNGRGLTAVDPSRITLTPEQESTNGD